MNKYEILIYWNSVDEIFIAEVPELKGCIAHGASQSEALQEVNSLAKEWLNMAIENGWSIPEPKGKLSYA